jgi:hypothetical protein
MTTNTLHITDGSLINWQVELCPEMTTARGFTMASAIKGITLKLGKEYIRSKFEHELFDKLKIERSEKIIELINEIFE